MSRVVWEWKKIFSGWILPFWAQKRPKMAKNGPKWPKMAQNYPESGGVTQNGGFKGNGCVLPPQTTPKNPPEGFKMCFICSNSPILGQNQARAGLGWNRGPRTKTGQFAPENHVLAIIWARRGVVCTTYTRLVRFWGRLIDLYQSEGPSERFWPPLGPPGPPWGPKKNFPGRKIFFA